jgi:hypothetical protein
MFLTSMSCDGVWFGRWFRFEVTEDPFTGRAR